MDQRVEESIEDIRALLVWCVKNVNNKWNFHEYDHAARALGKLGALFSAIEAERDALRADAERYEAACFDAVMALAHASERYPVYNEAYERVSAAIAAKESK